MKINHVRMQFAPSYNKNASDDIHLNDETNISVEHEYFRMKSIIILIQNTTEWHGRAVELHSPECGGGG